MAVHVVQTFTEPNNLVEHVVKADLKAVWQLIGGLSQTHCEAFAAAWQRNAKLA